MADKLERITGNASLKRYFDSEYIGAYSLDEGAEPVVTIASLWYGEIVLGGGRKEPHVIIRFREKSVPGCEEVKPLILNATNRKTLKKLYGSDSADTLEGKQIKFYIDPRVRDPEGGGLTEGLRIRPTIPHTAEPPKCEDCKKDITAAGEMTAAQVLAFARQRFKASLCAECMKKRAAEAKQNQPEAPAETEAGNE